MINNKTSQILSIYLKINFLISTIFFMSFLIFYGENNTILFSTAASISTSAMLYLIYFILFRPFFRFSKIITPILTSVFILTNFILLVDFFIFRIWKFHINAMVLNILLSPAAFDSIQIGTGPIVIGVVYFTLALIFELWLLRFLKSKENSVEKWNSLFNRRIAPIVLVIALTEKVYYGIAHIRSDNEILESTKPIPLYQPLTFRGFARKYFGIHKVERDNHQVGVKKNAKINYPLKKINIQHPNPKHIFIFGSDAVRAEMVNATIMPNITSFSKEAIFFKENRSGGNATRFGLFSFFYGINAPYWFAFLNAEKGPVLFDVLKKLDYRIGIYSSTDTRWPEFRQTVFYQVKDKIHDQMHGKPWQKDTELTAKWIEWIKSLDKNKPIFSFVFLDAPHGRSYPKQDAIFKPDGKGTVNYVTTSAKDRTELFNQYKNAIRYDDKLLGKMLKTLKEKGLYNDSIVVFMSDHGEEFYEHGHFSHNNAFDKEQTNACLIVKMPGERPKVVERLASSIDFIPSLLKYLGVTNELGDFSNARNMFDGNYSRQYATCGSWYKNAIITPNYTYVFSNLPNEIMKTNVFKTSTYHKVNSYNKNTLSTYILDVLNENRRFIK